MNRCSWCESCDIYRDYHDHEWGKPVFDDKKQFEFVVLESAQAGLSWLTILKKRENYRKAYCDFDVEKVSRFTEEDIERLVNDPGIVRNRAKIAASVKNAQVFIKIQNEFGSFCNYLWGFVNNTPVVNSFTVVSELPARTELSDRISKDLKKRGFSFMGSTIMYAHLQAVGVVNDHINSCFRKQQIIKEYQKVRV